MRYFVRFGPSHRAGPWREISVYEYKMIPRRLRSPGKVIGWMQATRTHGGLPR